MTDDAWAERIWTELRRIADAIEALIPAPEPPPAPTPGCPHPEDQRVPLGTTPDGQEEWECRACRTHFP